MAEAATKGNGIVAITTLDSGSGGRALDFLVEYGIARISENDLVLTDAAMKPSVALSKPKPLSAARVGVDANKMSVYELRLTLLRHGWQLTQSPRDAHDYFPEHKLMLPYMNAWYYRVLLSRSAKDLEHLSHNAPVKYYEILATQVMPVSELPCGAPAAYYASLLKFLVSGTGLDPRLSPIEATRQVRPTRKRKSAPSVYVPPPRRRLRLTLDDGPQADAIPAVTDPHIVCISDSESDTDNSEHVALLPTDVAIAHSTHVGSTHAFDRRADGSVVSTTRLVPSDDGGAQPDEQITVVSSSPSSSSFSTDSGDGALSLALHEMNSFLDVSSSSSSSSSVEAQPCDECLNCWGREKGERERERKECWEDRERKRKSKARWM